MTMITPSYLGETIEYSSLHACRSTLEDPTSFNHQVQEGVIFFPAERPHLGREQSHRILPTWVPLSGG